MPSMVQRLVVGIVLLLLLSGCIPWGTAPPTEPAILPIPEGPYGVLRWEMVEYQIARREVTDPEVLQAMLMVPRHRFVPDQYLDEAYNDHPLPIGYGQTISQPYIVALMTEMLDLQPDHVVLEVGTGSGYQAAVLAELVDQVYTVEIIPELAQSAEARLAELGYDNVTVANRDGYYGWPEHAPYDRIIVTAAPDHIPPDLVEQLRPGGRMVIPVGPQGYGQTLWLVEKTEEGQIVTTDYGGVRFVPLVGGEEAP